MNLLERLIEWWKSPRCLPCYDFKDNGSLGCVRCGWNLSAHPREDIVRVLGEEAALLKDEWLNRDDD